ncbi:hypothetical protein [Polyangium mundeleinium]|uniref:Uncharacterized protein n=1 Tax=Polyangium mundeleinium TaxID=2995306 RepID=A0ABT5F6V2_9BACT|nr:hypothetical protein [Polyangium mundeleinium]MDC0748857.1 hypothetical protein [Polyangium mundeleinium]
MGIPPRASAAEISLVLLGCGAFVAVSPLRLAWAHPGRTWLAPFLVWALLIALSALAARGERGGRGSGP